ncbi:PucR family transcriptional regulator [Clostridium saccharoperbutylacetonicum]|uniref:PucR family transcriptional regulator n=1 Tax=Clostridium saccharoperbutylacetonicum TaxID=36745 RepID=UPI000983EA3A|nr:helix-turn-helix domain-containing protein [Clostridium saccharoperbutylacetonicum]AQR95400.1 purine catabolism regulatory protein [Clostridium saccharoperbutylacetonicum]NSB31257.1 sugar diacid utilization regulator [Clostridium saccharoperbutylacetonicum]
MNEKNDLTKKKLDLYDTLFSQDTIDEILNQAESFLQNPIFLLDTSYRIITRSKYAEAENSSIETHNGENYLIFDTINLMQKSKCIDTIYNTSNSFFHYSEQNLIFCSVKINNITIGYIGVLESIRKLKESDLEYTDTLSKVLSIQIQKENLFISNSGLAEEYYLVDLLENKIDNLEYFKKRLQFSKFNLEENLLMLSIPFKQKYNDFRHNFGLQQLINQLKNILGNSIAAYYKDMIIILVSNSNEYVITAEDSLLEFLKLNNLNCGISFVFKNLKFIKDFFYQTIYTLELSSSMKSNKHIYYFDDYVEYYMFYMASNSNNGLYKISLENLIHPFLRKLIDFDKENKSDLYETLKTYIENNRNANETSHKLNIHRSTFFYRLNKIQNLFDISFDSTNKLLKLELSFKLLTYNQLIN